MRLLRTLVLAVCVLSLPLAAAEAANRYLVQGTRLSPTTAAMTPLSVEFDKGSPLKVHLKRLKDGSMLMVSIQKDETVFLEQFSDSSVYMGFKLNMRDQQRQELVVLGFSNITDNRQVLQEIKVIASDGFGNLKSYPVRDFTPTEILRIPLQVNEKNALVVNQVGGTDMSIGWHGGEFVCHK